MDLLQQIQRLLPASGNMDHVVRLLEDGPQHLNVLNRIVYDQNSRSAHTHEMSFSSLMDRFLSGPFNLPPPSAESTPSIGLLVSYSIVDISGSNRCRLLVPQSNTDSSSS